MYIIGIDPGTETGVAFWDVIEKKLTRVETKQIHQVLHLVYTAFSIGIPPVMIIVEDAHKRQWFGKSGPEKWQGAGSIKRDCSIWRDFLEDHKFPHYMPAPKAGKTKLNQEEFKALTGWYKQTNEHSRDAGMLVYGMDQATIASLARVWASSHLG